MRSLPGLSVNWGPWSEVGMAADPTLKGILGSIGVEQIPPDNGLQVSHGLQLQPLWRIPTAAVG